MNVITQIQTAFSDFLKQTFELENPTPYAQLTLNVDEDKQAFGDLNANAAMILAKSQARNPREVAQIIVDGFKHSAIERIEIAGPGFINIFLTPTTFEELAIAIYQEKENFFKMPVPRYNSAQGAESLGMPGIKKLNYNIEFVSANPTGPLHFGHGRGGIIGDVLGNVLRFVGHNVTKEFYINDAGAQITKLGISLKIRCQQKAGMDIQLPEDAYAGEYLIDLADTCIAEYGIAVIGGPDSFFEQYGKEHMLKNIKSTLTQYGINHEVWFSEKTLHTDGSIDATIEVLKKNGHLFEQDGALWFRSTTFGDDKDRVMRKSSGELTYVAADAAYLQNKVERGFNRLIILLGHDHHGYEMRLQSLLKALNLQDRAQLDIIFYQLVKMKAGEQTVRMSKRAGNIITLQDIIDAVGTDVARFFYLNRKADAQLDFDLDLALKKTDENPVYYVQYAYVRTKSIVAKATQESVLANITELDARHLGTAERVLIKKIVVLKELLESISTNHHTHLLTYYALELSQTFHSYYGKNRVIDMEHPEQSRGRLLLITLLHDTLATTLTLLGISKPNSM